MIAPLSWRASLVRDGKELARASAIESCIVHPVESELERFEVLEEGRARQEIDPAIAEVVVAQVEFANPAQ